jgi:glycosyltransferase involved in cell wall biosynthesis
MISENSQAPSDAEKIAYLSNRVDYLEGELSRVKDSIFWRLNWPFDLYKKINSGFQRYKETKQREGKQVAINNLLKYLFNLNLYKNTSLNNDDIFQPNIFPLEENRGHQAYKGALLDKSLNIAWIVNGFMPNGGGHRNILRMCFFLEQFGHKVSLFFINTPLDDQALVNGVREIYSIQGEIKKFTNYINGSNIIIATHWETVNIAVENRKNTQALAYFVQDYEPMFYPMGSNYILSEQTYRLGLHHICSGAWAAKTLIQKFNAKAKHFTFPVDTAIYKNLNLKRKKGQIVFFAKPEMPRRCFEIGVQTLSKLYEKNKNINVVMYGSNRIKDFNYSFPVKIMSFIPTLDGLAEIYNSSELGVVFSTTNPSLVPYEMMACGLPVADLLLENTEANYGDSSEIAILGEPNPDLFADRLNHFLLYPELLESRRAAGLRLLESYPSETEAARVVEGLIIQAHKECSAGICEA